MTKIRHILTTTHGTRYLTGLGDGINTSIDPLDAIAAGLAWASAEVAVAKLREVRALYPDADLGLALVTLEAHPADPTVWQAATTQSFGSPER